jgi:hypothetical protein
MSASQPVYRASLVRQDLNHEDGRVSFACLWMVLKHALLSNIDWEHPLPGDKYRVFFDSAGIYQFNPNQNVFWLYNERIRRRVLDPEYPRFPAQYDATFPEIPPEVGFIRLLVSTVFVKFEWFPEGIKVSFPITHGVVTRLEDYVLTPRNVLQILRDFMNHPTAHVQTIDFHIRSGNVNDRDVDFHFRAYCDPAMTVPPYIECLSSVTSVHDIRDLMEILLFIPRDARFPPGHATQAGTNNPYVGQPIHWSRWPAAVQD